MHKCCASVTLYTCGRPVAGSTRGLHLTFTCGIKKIFISPQTRDCYCMTDYKRLCANIVKLSTAFILITNNLLQFLLNGKSFIQWLTPHASASRARGSPVEAH